MTFNQHELQLSTGPLRHVQGGQGRPILYLHSAGGVRLTAPIQNLARSFTVHIPTLPGFDGTEVHKAVASMPALADLVAEFMATFASGPCDVIGHSFGGWVAMWLAARHPERGRSSGPGDTGRPHTRR